MSPVNILPLGILDGRYVNTAGDAMVGRLAYKVSNIADGDATPNVSSGNVFVTANTSQTIITQFDGGVAGQVMRLHFRDVFTRVQHGVNIRLQGGIHYPSPISLSTAYDVLILSTIDGTIFVEESRSHNS